MIAHRSPKTAFTLIEMLTVMAVIAILAGLIVAVQGYAQKKSALLRAEGEIKTMAAAAENYKADNGDYPRDQKDGVSITDTLDPRQDGDPTTLKYQNASLELYKALSGDEDANGKAKDKPYCEFTPNQLQKTSSGEIKYIKDPFGNSYGYSTAGAAMEAKYREELTKNPQTQRPTGTELKGFNPSFDLWSTGGVVTKSGSSSGGSSSSGLQAEQKRWIKNW